MSLSFSHNHTYTNPYGVYEGYKEKKKKNDEISIPPPVTRTVDRPQAYLKFSSK